MFIWAPVTMFKSIVRPRGLPCITQNCSGVAQKKGLGRPRVVVGGGGGNVAMPNTGQYYIVASLLSCKKCKCSPWYADSPLYLPLLPTHIHNIFPAYITYRKAVCRSLVDQMRRSGRSPADIANEVKELLQLRYERAHHQYLLLLQKVRLDARRESTLDESVGLDPYEPSMPFCSYSCQHGYRGVAVSEYFIADTLIAEYKEQRPYLYGLLKGTFGRYWRSDHTCTLAKKVELLSGVMWSYATLNEYWEVVSWVMVDADSEEVLTNYYEGLSSRYELAQVEKASIRWVDRWCCVSLPTSSPKNGEDEDVVDDLNWDAWVEDEGGDKPVSTSQYRTSSGLQLAVDRRPFARQSACRVHYNPEVEELLDAFHCIRRLGRACVAESHPAYGRFMSLLSSAFFIIDENDLGCLMRARQKLGMKGKPTKKEVRCHCRTRIPPPDELQQRVESVMHAFMPVEDMSGLRLFTPRMLREWHLQRVHIQRGCLSDPVVMPGEDGDTSVAGGVPYRLAQEKHLGGVVSPETKLNVWQPMRGSSQLEGFHPHQSKWVTGTRVSPALFQAQSFLGLGRWNWKRAVEHRNLCLPIFDPRLTAQLNTAHVAEYGQPKYPDFNCSNSPTGELFGVEYSQLQSKTMTEQMETICSSSVEKSADIVHTEHGGYNQEEPSSDSEDLLEAGLDLSLQDDLTELMVGGDILGVLGADAHYPKKPASPASAYTYEGGGQPGTPSPMDSGSSTDPDAYSPLKRSRETDSTQEESQEKRHRMSPVHQPGAQKLTPRKELRRSTFAGQVTNLAPERWTTDMKDTINGLLAKVRGKRRLSRVEEEYRRLVLGQADNPHSRLHMTNRHFIQLYERRQNRRLEGSAAVNFSDAQAAHVDDVTTDLARPGSVPVHVISADNAQVSGQTPQVTPPQVKTPKQRPHWKRPDEPSQDSQASGSSTDNLVQSITSAVLASLGLVSLPVCLPHGATSQGEGATSHGEGTSGTKPKTKRVRKKDPKSGSNVGGRNCMYCGGPKGKMAGVGNLHYTYVKKGETGFFYCPKRVAAEYGVPDTMTFPEFRASPFWDAAIQKVRQEKEEKARKKEQAAALRAEKGWKKPGGGREGDRQ